MTGGIQDDQLLLCEEQSLIINSGSDALTTRWHNIGNLFGSYAGGNIGAGAPIYGLLQLTAALTGTNSVLTVTIETDVESDFDTTNVVLVTLTPILQAQGVLGLRVPFTMPFGGNYKPLIRGRFAASGANITAGAGSMWLSPYQTEWHELPSAVEYA